MNWEKILKCILLGLGSVVALCLIAVLMRIDAAITQAQIDTPQRLDRIETQIGSLKSDADTLISRADETLVSFARAGDQANGLIGDVRKELPGLKNATNIEVSAINGQISTATRGLIGIVTRVNPAIDAAKVTIDQVNASLPDFLDCYNDGFGNDNCLFNRYQGVSKSFEQMAQTIDATVKREATPTAEAIRRSAEGTAKSTANAAQLISDSDKFVNLTTDLIYGKRTFWQRFRAFCWGVANLGAKTAAAW